MSSEEISIKDSAVSSYPIRKDRDLFVTILMRGLTRGIVLGTITAVISGLLIRAGMLHIPFFSFLDGMKTGDFLFTWPLICISLGMLIFSGIPILINGRHL